MGIFSRNVAINGLGRIGKQFFLAAIEKKANWNFQINHPDSLDHIVYALKHDSVHPTLTNVTHDGTYLIVNKKKIKVTHERDPLKLPWKQDKIDLVIECTGFFTKRPDASKHLKAGAKRVLISAPSKDCDRTIVYGINNKDIKKSDKIISAASCTTNCLTPMAKVVHDNLKILKAEFITTHAYTSTQRLIDGDDKKDMRRGRSAGMNIVPTSSGASIATIQAIPDLKGKLDGFALRVPVVDGSITTLVCDTEKATTTEELNAMFKKAASKELKEILEYTEAPLVSSDIIHNPNSCILDAGMTRVNQNFINVVGWYDNEWGYSNRLVDVAKLILKL